MIDMKDNVAELKSLVPILEEKEKAGLIRASSQKARDLVAWFEAGRRFSEKQEQFVGRLIRRAKQKHRNVKLDVTKTDTDAVAEKVLEVVNSQREDLSKLMEEIEPRILKKLEERAPRKVEIVIKKGTQRTKLNAKNDYHHQFPGLLRAASARLANGYAPGIFLQGEASSGKTHGAKQLAEALKLNWYFNGAISFPHEMLGFIDGSGKYHRTPFRDAYEKGGVYTFDEVDRSDPVALLAVNPHLANGIATFPDKQIKRHPDCIIVCTANTWGLGADAQYSGATKLDAAFLSRFPVRINWDIDLELESKIVSNAEWLTKVRAARERARSVGLKVMIDTRVALAGTALIEQGFSMEEAAEMTYLANLKPSQRQQIAG